MDSKRISKIKLTFYVVAVLWIAVIAQIIVNKSFKEEGKIIEAFANTSSNLLESKLSLIADYGNKYMTELDKKELIKYISNEIGLNNDYKIVNEHKNNSNILKCSKDSKNANTIIEIVSMEDKKEDNVKEVKQYVLVDLTIKENMKSILKYKDILEKSLTKVGLKDIQTTMKITGEYKGELSNSEKEKAASQVLNYLDAKVVSANKDKFLYTIYAYTGIIGEYIEVSDKRVNVNIAFNYDEISDKTNMYLATPILNEDY